MKSNKIKGFTLIECLVALAILGIASLIMAQIYASVSKINQNNHMINSSLAYQVKYIEKYTDDPTETVVLYALDDGSGNSKPDSDTDAPHVDATKKLNYVKFVSSYTGTNTYSYTVDIFVMLSRKADGTTVSVADEDNYNLRYKYLQGHTN